MRGCILSDIIFKVPTKNRTFFSWNILYVQTNPRHLSDQEQAECAGRVEGIATNFDIYTHYHNNVRHWCKGREKTCKKVAKFLKEHFDWVEQNIQELGNRSEIWHHVSFKLSIIK